MYIRLTTTGVLSEHLSEAQSVDSKRTTAVMAAFRKESVKV